MNDSPDPSAPHAISAAELENAIQRALLATIGESWTRLAHDSLDPAALEAAIQRALLVAIVESSNDAIVSKTLDGTIRSWNSGAARLFGYTAEEIVGKSITTIIPAELHGEEKQILDRLRRGERIEHFETTRIAKGGRRIDVSVSISPVLASNGVVIAASKSARDITEQKRVERAQAQLAAIVEFSDDAIVSKSLDGIIQSWNAAATRIFGYTAEEMIGKPITTIIPAELHAEERRILERVRAGQRVEPFDTIREAKGGRRIAISLTVSPIRDSRGVVIGASKVARDISERKHMEEMLRQSAARLLEADRRKDEFVALLAHELRNPLAPIRYALGAAKKPGRSAEQRERAEEIIERQVAHMSHLLDDLLDVSRITRAALELKKTRTHFAAVLDAAIETARPYLDARNHTLSLDVPRDEVSIEVDTVRLSQVFSNLLINAAKFTHPGGRVDIRAKRAADVLIVSVSDNGLGIAEDMMPKLFMPFSQADAARRQSDGGLGLGLSLVRGLVTLHGGSVQARSDGPDRGSEFIVQLPVAPPVGTPSRDLAPDPGPQSPAAGRTVVVVDDNRDAAETCAMFLELSGHTVRTAHSGRAALELAETFRADVFLIDIGLPDISGYELARTIRKTPWGPDVLLIAVTGWGQEEDRNCALEAGFDRHLTKPAAAEVLEELIGAWRGPEKQHSPAGPV